tara:strand:- start:1192 stop:3072 length:1881 start_codon:yes stop_codon:yes gene_type:complete
MRSEIHMFADQPRKQTTKPGVYGIEGIYKKIFELPAAFIWCLLASKSDPGHHLAVQDTSSTPYRLMTLLLSTLVLSISGFQNPAMGEEAFVDVSKAAGLNVRHENGARGAKLLPETINGGAGWIDYDGDGHLDLYLVQGHSDSSKAFAPGDTGNRLYRNTGKGSFVDVTDKAGVGDRNYGSALAVGDIDNDGDQDLYVTNFGPNTLYINNGDGTFRDATAAAGVGTPFWSSSACFADINGDGLLDLYVANYLLYDTRVHKACTSNSKKLASYCHPNKYNGAPDSLYLNRGEGKFEDISKQAGIAVSGRILSKGLGVLPTDYDSDGDIDFLVANDSVPNFLWRNLGEGRFEDAALEAGVALNTTGSPEACMGVDGGDVNGDGLQDYFLTNFSEETDTLFFGEGDGFFDDNTLRSGLGKLTFAPLGFGTRLFDYDLDGDLDIYVTRGHILDNLEALHPGSRLQYAQPDHLFQNDGRGLFKDVSGTSGSWFQRKLVGRAVATADYDSDGDLDLFIVNSGQECTLLENRAIRKGSWVGIRLQGNGPCSRDAVGSMVTVKTATGSRHVEARNSQGYMAANDPRMILSIEKGAATAPPIEVRWSDGLREAFPGLQAERYHLLVRTKGKKIGK